MRNLAPLSEGVPAVEGWRLVAASDPALVEALEDARAAYDENEPAWQQKITEYQTSRDMKRRRLQSPFAKALALAEAAVAARLEELIREGVIVYAGYPQGQLDGAPVAIPVALLAGRRPRGSRFTIRGVEFFGVRLFRAADLAVVEPVPVTDPPPTDDRLVEALADLFAEDQAWETLGPAKLAPIVAQRDRRFRPDNGIWAAATLVDKIKTLKQVAKAEARARGA